MISQSEATHFPGSSAAAQAARWAGWSVSVLCVPLGVAVFGVSGLGAFWHRWLAIPKDSDLPGFEYVPLLVFAILGLLLAFALSSRERRPFIFWLSLLANVGFLVMTVHAFFHPNRC